MNGFFDEIDTVIGREAREQVLGALKDEIPAKMREQMMAGLACMIPSRVCPGAGGKTPND
jgi:hypothetical protein